MFLTSQRFWKRLGIGCLIVVAVLLLAYLVADFWAGHRLESRLAKLRAAGEPTSIKELEAPIPVDDNAAMVVEGVRKQVEAFSKAQAGFGKLPAGKAFFDSGKMSSEEQLTAIRSILAMFPEVASAIEQAARCNYHVPARIYSDKPQYFFDYLKHSMTLSRGISRFGSWQILVAIGDEDFDKAARIGIDMLRLARLRDSEPMMVSGLVGLALRGAAVSDLNRVLRSGDISPEVRLQLDQELARHDNPLWLANVLKSERAYNLDASGDLFSYFPMTWQGRLVQADTLDMYEDLLAVLAKPRYESRGELPAVFERSYSTPISESLVRLLEPSLQAARDSFDRTVAEMRCLRIFNTLQSQEQHTNKESVSLEELDLPGSATIDPFTGESLKMKLTDDGWVVYSVMKDVKDDGGNFDDQKDWGVAPVDYSE